MPEPNTPPNDQVAFLGTESERDRYRDALKRIAYHEPQHDERAEAMRQIAREALDD